jgi:uncharacterized protein YggE
MKKNILIFILNSAFVFGGEAPSTVTTHGRASLNVIADELLIRGQINKSNATFAEVEKELKATQSQFDRAFKADLPNLKNLNIRALPIYPDNRPFTVAGYSGEGLPGMGGGGLPGMGGGGLPGMGGGGLPGMRGASSAAVIDPISGLPIRSPRGAPNGALSGLKWKGALIIEIIVPINGGDLQKLVESDVIKSTGLSLKFIPNYSDTKKVQLRLDEMAFEDAKFKAGNLASLGGKTVGEVVSISENIGVPSGAPMIDPVTGLPIPRLSNTMKTIESNLIVTFKLRP